MRLYSHPNSDDIWGTKYPGMGTYNNVCPGICNMHVQCKLCIHTEKEGWIVKEGLGGETSIANLVPISATNGRRGPFAIHCLLTLIITGVLLSTLLMDGAPFAMH